MAARRASIAEAHAQLLRPGLVLVLVEPELGVVGPPLGRRVVLRAAVETLGILQTKEMPSAQNTQDRRRETFPVHAAATTTW